jgi:uncharacterized protein (TIGR03437 family)
LRLFVFGGALALPFAAPGQSPQISVGGIVNSANYGPMIAPGSLFSIFGTGLATTAGGITSTPYPTKINETQVTVNGEAVPLTYVSPSVINAQMPFDQSGVVSVVVTVNGESSAPVSADINLVGPAIYTADGSGKNLVSAQRCVPSGGNQCANLVTITASAPANPGDVIVLYATGLGATNPPLATNTPPTAAAPAAQTPIVTIGGQPAQVLYSGAAGVYPGLYQINLYVPNVVAGNQEVVVRMPDQGIASTQNATLVVGGANQGTPVTPAFFGLHVIGNVILGVPFSGQLLPWPTFNFGPVRLHDVGASWIQLNTAPNQYNWTPLDNLISHLVARGKTDLVYTFSRTPAWAATDPGLCSGVKCPSPPADLNADGSGPNQYWKDFVTAIAQRYAGEVPGKISHWEIWNEPSTNVFWTGTTAQLVRMADDARTIIKGIDPQADILSPAPGAGGAPPGTAGIAVPVASEWLASFLPQTCTGCGSVTGASTIDITAFHGYTNLPTQPNAEDALQGISAVESAVSAVRQGLPLWNTEGSWGPTVPNSPGQVTITDPDVQAGFLARSYLSQASMISRYYWYHYGYDTGQLLDPATGQLNKAGVAYGIVFNWMTGAALTQPCAAQSGSNVWTCAFARQNGFQALAVWDSSLTCANGACSTSNFTPPSNMIKYSDLDGNTVPITSGSAVPVGAKPIWLTNQ